MDVGRWFVWHAGELALSVGFLPAVCVGLLLWAAIRRGSPLTAADRAFVAVALAGSFWFALQAAAFASRFSGRIEERYMLYAAPLLLIALAVWVGRDLPRSPTSILVASLVPALLVMTIPFEQFFNVSILADTFGLIPFMRLTNLLDGGVGDLRIVVAGGLALAALVFLVLGRRAARVLLPASVALFFLLSGYTVHGALQDQSVASAGTTGVSDPNWVDDTIGSDGAAGYIYGPSDSVNPHRLWQTEFWNRSVKGVYPLDADPVSSYSDDELDVNEAGHLVPRGGGESVDEPYVLADPNLAIAGEVVAKPGPLALIRVSRPLRIASSVDGLYADGWTGPQAGLSQYEPLAGGARRMQVRVSRAGWTGADVPGRVTIAAGPLRQTNGTPTLGQATATREWTVHSGQTRTFDLPVPRAPFRIEVRRGADVLAGSVRPGGHAPARRPAGVLVRMTASGDPKETQAAPSAEAITSELWGRKAREKVRERRLARLLLAVASAHGAPYQPARQRGRERGLASVQKRQFLPEQVERGLSLGCGSGRLEREAPTLSVCRSFDALDISEDALEAAAGAAEQAGFGDQIDYRQADLNSVSSQLRHTTWCSPSRCCITSMRSSACSTRCGRHSAPAGCLW